jgi:hypothetical protein
LECYWNLRTLNMIVLNVGGGPTRSLPSEYDGWKQHLLDIDPSVNPDVCCDAKEMGNLAPEDYDAVYCSHNLEHFYAHDVPVVLSGFMHVLKSGGFVHISVPNIKNLMQSMLAGNLDINDVWYRAGDNPITFHDVLYGWSAAMNKGNLFYSHKCGFTPLSLSKALNDAGFDKVRVLDQGANITAVGYKKE